MLEFLIKVKIGWATSFCGLIHHVLDQEVGGLNPAVANFFGGERGEARSYALAFV